MVWAAGLVGSDFRQPSQLARVDKLMTARLAVPNYLVISTQMKAYCDYYGIFPPGSLDRLRGLMLLSPHWKVVYDSPDVWGLGYTGAACSDRPHGVEVRIAAHRGGATAVGADQPVAGATEKSWRVSLLDSAWTRSTSVSMVGPIDLPGRSDLVQALRAHGGNRASIAGRVASSERLSR